MIPFTWKPTYTYFAGGLLLLLALFFAVSFITGKVKDYQHDKITTQLKAEREALRVKADADQARAEAAEADKVKFQVALEVAGKNAEASLKKVTDANEQYEKEIQSIGVDVDACERYTRLRAKLGLSPAPCY
jgi:dihydroxyacetone kinase